LRQLIEGADLRNAMGAARRGGRGPRLTLALVKLRIGRLRYIVS